MILSVFSVLYSLLWILLLPLVIAYLWWRGRRDPDYFRHLSERFGVYPTSLPNEPLWFHAVSLGETRSAVGLIRLALARGDNVVITNFTPAGRREAERQFDAEIATGQVAVIYSPFDIQWFYQRFFRACRPRIGLTLEVEIWPGMIWACKRAGVPLYLCNAQYAEGPFARDSKGLRLRQRVIKDFAGGFVKSRGQAERFAKVGLQNITITGELRFDQPVPDGQTEAAQRVRRLLPPAREVIVIASGTEGEEAIYESVIHRVLAGAKDRGVAPPLFVYVPRAPERFEGVAADLAASGLKVLRRSEALGAAFEPVAMDHAFDVFVGNSLGEMFFYLSLADRVIVGGGFTPHGSHNIIEPLMMGKPTIVGPVTWPIEFPFVEAEAAGVVKSVADEDKLLKELSSEPRDLTVEIAAFLKEYSGASQRTLDEIDKVLS